MRRFVGWWKIRSRRAHWAIVCAFPAFTVGTLFAYCAPDSPPWQWWKGLLSDLVIGAFIYVFLEAEIRKLHRKALGGQFSTKGHVSRRHIPGAPQEEAQGDD